MTRLALILLAALAVLAPPAFAQGDAADRARIADLEREVSRLAERMTQVEIEESRLAAREAELEKQVEALKKASPGMVRDAELQTALRNLRAVLAEVRNLDRVEQILLTTLRTRQVDLFNTATREATRLIQSGEQAVHAGDDRQAMRDFARGFAYLELGQGPQSRNLMGHGQRRMERVAIPGDIPVTGRESPDELREMAFILRDAAEKLKANARVAGDELTRFREERDILRTLQQAETRRSPSMQGVLAFLEQHIARLEAELSAIRRGLSARVTAAIELERQAAQYESVLLNEPGQAGGTRP